MTTIRLVLRVKALMVKTVQVVHGLTEISILKELLLYAHWFKRGQVIQLSPVHWVKLERRLCVTKSVFLPEWLQGYALMVEGGV